MQKSVGPSDPEQWRQMASEAPEASTDFPSTGESPCTHLIVYPFLGVL